MGRSKIKVLAVGVGRKNFVILQALIEDAFPSVAVIAAQSGKEGLDLAAKENPDVILLDIMLHEMDGFTLCAQFKADKTLRDIPVVFVIGKKGGKENRIKALESGADAFLSKPFDESELTAHLRAMLKVNTANIRLHSEKQSTVRMVKKKTANLKDVKEELQREQTILEAIFDSIPGYLYVYDYSGKLIKWNKQYETMTGYSAEELSHMTFEDWFGQEDLGRVKAAVRNVFEKGYGEVEAQLILKNEKKMMIRANGVLLMINGQKYFAGIGVDITQQKLSERSATIVTDYLHSMFSNMSSGVAIFQVLNDGESGKDYIIVDLNSAALEIADKGITEIVGKSLLDMRPNIDEYGLIPVFQQVWKTGKSAYYPSKVYIDEKYCNWYESRVFKLSSGGIVSIYDDVTDKMVSSEKLNESEKMYRQIADNITDVVWTTDLNFNSTYMSPSAEILFGESAEVRMARSLKEKFAPESLAKIRAFLDEETEKEKDPAFDKNRTKIIETQQYRADRSIVWVSVHISLLRDETGKAVGFLGVSRDITERKKIEAELRKNLEKQKRDKKALLASETRYRRLFESAKDGILILDAKTGQIEDVNPFLINLLGYTKEQFLHKHVWEIGALKDQIFNYEKFVELQKNDYIRYEDMPLQTAKGKLIHVEFVSNVYTVNNNEVIQCNIRDMTERKKIETALLESENKYTSYIENAPDAVFVIDDNGRYVDANPAATAITGYSKEELLTMSIKDITARESLHEALRHFKTLLETGASTGELQYLHKSGDIRWWSVDAVRLTKNRYLGFSGDITDKKKSEESLIYFGYHDFLTGLNNRRFFEEELRRLDTKKNLPLAVMMCDINGLKLVNDSFGHAAGDTFLKAAAAVIKNECRAKDIIARIGGDEFAVILRKTNADAAMEIAKRIQTSAQKVSINNISLSISYGIDTKVVGNQILAETLANAENAMQTQKLYEISSRQNKTIDLIMNALFEKSKREAVHCNRVSSICGAIALEMGMGENAVNRLRTAGLVHDIGKIGIDEKILNKPGRLDSDEYREIYRHPEAGWRILSATNEFSELAQYVLAHQEKWDGSGYPKGLQGEEIPLEARIIGIADAYEAMTGDRPYRKRMSAHEAVAELVRCSGEQFDPVVVSVFVNRVLPKYSDFINRSSAG